MEDKQPNSGHWISTLPGVITGLAALVTALTGAWAVALNTELKELRSVAIKSNPNPNDKTKIEAPSETPARTPPSITVANLPSGDMFQNTSHCILKASEVIRSRGGVVKEKGESWADFVVDNRTVMIRCKESYMPHLIVAGEGYNEVLALAGFFRDEIAKGN